MLFNEFFRIKNEVEDEVATSSTAFLFLELFLLGQSLPELLHLAYRVHNFFFARIERMAFGADFNLNKLFG